MLRSVPANSFVAKRPSVQTTFGLMIAICFIRWELQTSISSGVGSRFSGGRHFTTFAMHVSLVSPIP